MTDRPDLDALADWLANGGDLTGMQRQDITRIIRAVAAAPGPLRSRIKFGSDGWDNWFDALADAVGEPG